MEISGTRTKDENEDENWRTDLIALKPSTFAASLGT